VNRLVHGGEVDIGLTFTLAPARGVKVEFSQSAPILAVMSISHPLAGKRRLALSELAAYPMALPAKRIAMRQLIDACCSRKNLMIEPVLTSDSIDAILTFVTLGGGIAFSAELPIRRLIEQGRIAAVSIQDPDMNALQLQVQTLEGRILPQAARVFLDTLVAAIPPAASTPKS
jgi:DNA-binding transcriptional LysR family regulator